MMRDVQGRYAELSSERDLEEPAFEGRVRAACDRMALAPVHRIILGSESDKQASPCEQFCTDGIA